MFNWFKDKKKKLDKFIGKTADKSFRSAQKYKAAPKGGAWMSDKLQKTSFFKPTNKVRTRDVVSEAPRTISRGNKAVVKAMGEGVARLGISAFELPSTFKNKRATGKFYKTPFGRVNSFQSEAQNRARRGDPLWKSAGNPMADTLLAGVDISAIAKPALGLAKGAFKKTAPEVSKFASDLNQPIMRKIKVPGTRTIKREPVPGVFSPGGKQQMRELPTPIKRKIQIEKTVPNEFQSRTMQKLQRPGMTIKETGKVRNVPAKPRQMTPVRKFFTSGEKLLKKQGEGGQKISDLIKKTRTDSDLLRGSYQVRFNSILEGMSKKERIKLTDILEGKAKDKNLNPKAQKIRELLDEIGTKAEKEGFEIRTPDGKSVPFKKREDYFPRIYNFDKLTKGKQKDKALQSLIDNGSARNKAEAEKLLSGFIKSNAERKAGNLENSRMFDLPGYEKDPQKAISAYINSTSKRFAEASNYGKKDEKVASLINRIADEGGDYNEAQNVFDLTTNGTEKNKFVNAVTQWNLATKLDLSAITNATQSINTMTKAGIKNTIKGSAKSFTKKGDDLAELSGVYDNFIHVQEQGFNPTKIVEGILKPFEKVERFNRRAAANTAEYFAKDLQKKLIKNPKSKYAIDQLNSLGIDPFKAIDGELTPKDLLTAANKLAEKTQFKVEPIDVPPAWKKPLARLAVQFKSFTFMQTKFVRDDVLKPATQGNFAPLVRFLMLAPMASYGAQFARNKVTGRKEGGSDVRSLDKWFKAAGTLPTEMATQAKFVKDTWSKPYLTPLKKVSRTASTFGGATVGEVGNILTALESKASTRAKNNEMTTPGWKTKDENFELKRYGAGAIPFVGEYIKNAKYGYQKSNSRYKKIEEATGEKIPFKERADKTQYSNTIDQKRFGEIQTDVYAQAVSKLEQNSAYQQLSASDKQKALDDYSKDFDKHAKAQMVAELVRGLSNEQLKNKLIELKEAGFMSKEVYKIFAKSYHK